MESLESLESLEFGIDGILGINGIWNRWNPWNLESTFLLCTSCLWFAILHLHSIAPSYFVIDLLAFS